MNGRVVFLITLIALLMVAMLPTAAQDGANLTEAQQQNAEVAQNLVVQFWDSELGDAEFAAEIREDFGLLANFRPFASTIAEAHNWRVIDDQRRRWQQYIEQSSATIDEVMIQGNAVMVMATVNAQITDSMKLTPGIEDTLEPFYLAASDEPQMWQVLVVLHFDDGKIVELHEFWRNTNVRRAG